MNKRKNMNSLLKSMGSISTAVLLVFGLMLPVVSASISPATFEATLKPGESATETKTVTIPALPPKADVIFAFDLTGSMGSTISTAKAKSIDIMNNLSATGVDINYGVMSYMDYPHSYSSYGYSSTYGSYPCGGGDYAYKLNQAVTSDKTVVSNAINGLILGCGADGPQDYTRIFYESYADSSVGWRSGAKKIIVNFGDNVPHDDNLNEGVSGISGTWSTGGDPGRDEIMFTADDLNLQTVLGAMASNNVILIEAHTADWPASYEGGPAGHNILEFWNYWTGLTGGKTFITGSTTLADDVVNAVTATLTAPTVNNLHLQASSGYESWLVSSTPASYSGPTGVTTSFDIVIKVPDGTSPGDYTFTISAVDNAGVNYGDQTVIIHVLNPNNPPVAVPGGPYSGNEGSAVNLDGSLSSDPDAGDSVVSYQWDFGDGSTGSGATVTHTYKDNGAYTVSLTVTDTHGATDTKTTTANIANVAPTVGPITIPADPQPVGTTISISSPFTDPGVLDTHTATIDWNDGAMTAGTVTETAGSGSVAGSHAYSAPGVYTITLTVTDKDGGVGTAVSQYVVVYDPNGGFVTGGGWITSPAGAYIQDTSLTGRANFGFVSKYKKGATVPTGETEFQFQVANLNFHSTAYDWLVIAGARAQYKGTGTINGAGNYGFLLTAIDGAINGGGGTDKFRIKIWDKNNGDAVVYDNELGTADDGAPTTILKGGSIVIHS
ncbi:PKD domain protein [uncultured archaeon]|nr:PKD domain protein [uncultured archaeon]